MFYVYLLKSTTDQKYYIGQTQDLVVRLKRHNDGFVPSTKHRRPLQLIGYETFETRNLARFREYQLKNSTLLRTEFYKKFDTHLHPSSNG